MAVLLGWLSYMSQLITLWPVNIPQKKELVSQRRDYKQTESKNVPSITGPANQMVCLDIALSANRLSTLNVFAGVATLCDIPNCLVRAQSKGNKSVNRSEYTYTRGIKLDIAPLLCAGVQLHWQLSVCVISALIVSAWPVDGRSINEGKNASPSSIRQSPARLWDCFDNLEQVKCLVGLDAAFMSVGLTQTSVLLLSISSGLRVISDKQSKQCRARQLPTDYNRPMRTTWRCLPRAFGSCRAQIWPSLEVPERNVYLSVDEPERYRRLNSHPSGDKASATKHKRSREREREAQTRARVLLRVSVTIRSSHWREISSKRKQGINATHGQVSYRMHCSKKDVLTHHDTESAPANLMHWVNIF